MNARPLARLGSHGSALHGSALLGGVLLGGVLFGGVLPGSALSGCKEVTRHDVRAPTEDAGARADASDSDPATAPPSVSATAPKALPPLGGDWLLSLRDGKDDLGVVSVPLGATAPRPVVIALHGGGDRPSWACGEWRGVTNAYPFIVCPRGQGSDAGLYWGQPAMTKRAIDRALDATRATYATYMRDAPYVLVGFSMGATQAAILSREDHERYPRIALSENAYDPKVASAFATSYLGARVLWSCTTSGCEPVYRSTAAALAKRGVPSRVNLAGTNAHGIWDTVVRSLRRDWPWLVEGAPGWEAYVPPREDAALPGKTLSFDAP